MDFLVRLSLWMAGIVFLVIIAKGLELGMGKSTQLMIILWVVTIYCDASYHDFKFIE